ncbi:MAG: hypothetical protein KTR31_19140 [Myxococcales bacterium]|nr:hypothetical protein [Myxococcales bacterium]
MITLLLATSSAVAEPDSDWLDTLLLASGRDGTWMAAAEVPGAFAQLCEEGVQAACGDSAWARPFDEDAAKGRSMAFCDEGDGVACLIVGWTSDGVEAVAAFDRACALGAARGCTERVLSEPDGPDTFARLAALCEAQEPSACLALAPRSSSADREALFTYTMGLGSVAAMEAKASLPATASEDTLALLDAACGRGRPSACIARARATGDGSDHEEHVLESACQLGDAVGCAHLQTWRAEFRGAPMAPAVAAHEAACGTGAQSSCNEAVLLAAGTPPRTFLRWGVPAWLVDPVRGGLSDHVMDCYRERVFRGDTRGVLRVVFQANPEGVIEGAAPVPGPLVDDAFTRCVSEQEGELVWTRPGRWVRDVVEWRLDHEAYVDVLEVNTEDPEDATIANRMIRALTWELDRCLTKHGEIGPEPLALSVVLTRKGAVKRAEVVRSTLQPEVDSCVVRRLAQGGSTERLKSSLRMLVLIDFLKWVDPGERRPEVSAPSMWTGEPLVWTVRSVVGPREDGGVVSSAQLHRLQEAHNRAAVFLRRHTGSRILLRHEVVVSDQRPQGLVVDEEIEGERVATWLLQADGLPDDVAFRDTTHSLIFWVESGGDDGYPDRGSTLSEVHCGGATVSGSPVGWRAPWVRLVELLYDQLAVRAPDRRWPSRRTAQRLDDGRVFEPRSWVEGGDSALWLAWAFAEGVEPDAVVAALSTKPVRTTPRGDNLARRAVPTASRDMTGRHLINDGVLAMPGLRSHALQGSVARTPPDGTWVGVDFGQATTVSEVWAWTTTEDEPTRSTAHALSLVITRDGETWQVAKRVEPVEGPVTRLSIPATPVFGVRVRVDVEDPVRPVAFRELEIYAAPTGAAP